MTTLITRVYRRWGIVGCSQYRHQSGRTFYCNKHIRDGVSLNGERLIVVDIVIVDYLHSLVGESLVAIRPEGTKSNR